MQTQHSDIALGGLLAGALATAVLQSSSATTVLIVGFITAGLMNFQQSIGVIIGSKQTPPV